MIEQISNAISFYGFFIESKVGKTGLTVTVDVWRINTAGTATEVVTGGSATEVGDGLYRYTLAVGSVTVEGEYVCVFKTATTSVDQQHIPALWVIQKAGVENLDVSLSKIRKYLQLVARKDAAIVADNATELGELNANGGNGAGGFAPTTESLEAIAANNPESGPGPRIITVTVNDGAAVLANATVSAYANDVLIGQGTTNGSGVAILNLPDGTFDIAIMLAGYNFNGETLVVTGNTSPSPYSMSQISVSAPADPAWCTLRIKCWDEGVAEAGVVVSVKIVGPVPGGVGNALKGVVKTDTSGADGITTFVVPRGCSVNYRRGTSDTWEQALIPTDAGVVTIGDIVGSP